MNIAILVICSLALVCALVDVYVSAKHYRPHRRRALHLDLAKIAVAAAEQRFRGAAGAGGDKARYARQWLIGQGVPATTADVLVEHVVSGLKK